MVPHQSLCVVTTSKYELQEEELEVWGGVKTDTRVTTQNNASPPHYEIRSLTYESTYGR